jgi:hypothetical protein
MVSYIWFAPKLYKSQFIREWFLCGSGVEYLHRRPARCRKRQKGKSLIWESKIWSRVPRDLDPRMNALARPAVIVNADASSRQRGCYIRTTTARVQLKKKMKFWPWVSKGSAPRRTDWRYKSSRKIIVTLTLTLTLIRQWAVVQHSAVVSELSVQLWSANQRTMEAEEVTDS